MLEPLHVEALLLIEGVVLNEGGKLFVNAVALEVLDEGGLEALVQGGELGTTEVLDLSLEAGHFLVLFNVGDDGDLADLDLRWKRDLRPRRRFSTRSRAFGHWAW